MYKNVVMGNLVCKSSFQQWTASLVVFISEIVALPQCFNKLQDNI